MQNWTIKKKKMSAEELVFLNCGAGEEPWESHKQQEYQTSQSSKEINPEYSLQGLMLKPQYFGHLTWEAGSLEKTDAGKDWRQKKKRAAEDEM